MSASLERHTTHALEELQLKRRGAYLFRYVLWMAGRGWNEDREAVDEVLMQHAHRKPSARHAHSLHQTCAYISLHGLVYAP